MIFVCFIGLAGPIQLASAQGKLSRIRESVRPPKPAKTTPDRNDHENDDHDDDEQGQRSNRKRSGRDSNRNRNHRSSGGGGSFLSLFFSSPRTVERVHTFAPSPVLQNASTPNPIYVIEEYVEPVEQMAPAPVYETVAQPTIEAPTFDDQILNQWYGRMTAFVGSDFEDISLGSFGLLLQCPGFLGLDISAAMLRESGTSFRDHLWVGDANLVFEGTTGDLRSRIGVGLNWLGDRYGGEAGFNLTAGFDWQLARRLVLTGEADFGTLGDSDLFHGQISIGRQIQNAELMLGYNHLDIGGTTIGSAFTGVRFRF